MFAQPFKQDECEASEADVGEETGIGIYKIMSYWKSTYFNEKVHEGRILLL
jgi:hypothetical protein